MPDGDFRKDDVKALLCLPQVDWLHREKAIAPEASEQVELNLMDQRPTLQWIQFVDRLWNLARSKSVDGV
jgi:hypothetical protein